MSVNIAIDGPAGAGKSTIARKLAEELKYVYVDTGAMYRAMAYHFLKQGISGTEEKRIALEVQNTDVTIAYVAGEQQVLLNGENVNPYIRTEEVGNMASATSVYPVVRLKLMELQKKLAVSSDVIMDGRDIGTAVLPDAQVKIYLTASVETRAKRRYDENTKKGMAADLEEIAKDIKERDYRDMHREMSPLKKAEDAVLVDSSQMNIEEVVEAIRKIVKEKCNL